MQLRNNFSSGPDGTNISTVNSGNGDDDAFSTLNVGTGAKLKYKASVDRPSAEFMMVCGTTTTSTGSDVLWTPAALGTQGQVWMRFYLYCVTLPSNFNSPCLVELVGNASSVVVAYVTINSVGAHELAVGNGNNTYNIRTAASMVAGSWMRVEVRLQFSATTGNGELRYYANADADTDSPTETITWSGQNFIRNDVDTVAFGYCLADTNQPDMYWSGLEINSTGWPGPLPFHQKAVPGIQPSAIAVHNDVF